MAKGRGLNVSGSGDKSTRPGGGPAQKPAETGSWAVGVATIVLTLAGWTVTPLLIREFRDDVDGWTSNGWRYGFAALLWLPLLVWKRARGRWPRGLMRAALVPSLINSAAQVPFTWAFYLIDPGMVAFGLRMQIVAVTVGAAIMFPSERAVIRRPLFLVGVLMVLGGTLFTAAQSQGFGQGQSVLGVGLALAAGAGYAGYALAVRRFMVGYGSMESFAAISQYTAAAMVVIMLVMGERAGAGVMSLTPGRLGLFLLSSFIGIAAGHVLYYLSIARLGVMVSTGVVQLQPFTVGVLSVIIYGEVLRLGQWLTGGLAVGGAMLMLGVQHHARRAGMRRAAEALAEAAGSGAVDTGTADSEVEGPGHEFDELPPDAVAASAAAERAGAVAELGGGLGGGLGGEAGRVGR